MDLWKGWVAWAGLWFALTGALAACSEGGGHTAAVVPPTPASMVSGTIASASNTAVDGDTNDPYSSWLGNNTRAEAQPVAAPVSVGGFVSATGTGVSEDRFATDGDPADVYRAELLANQIVTLRISDHPDGLEFPPDLDLALYPAGSATEAAASRTDLETESVTVPASGSYDVVVEARSGSSNYALTIGAAAPASVAVEASFVPGEVLVRFAAASGAGVDGDGPGYRAARMGLRALGGAAGRTMLMALPQTREARTAALTTLGVPAAEVMSTGDGEEELRRQTLLAVEALRARPDVASADPNYIHHASAVPNDPHFGQQWHYSLINLPQAWDLETGASAPVTVAVVDSGVLLNHPDLVGKLVPGYDFVSDPDLANDGDGIDALPNDPGDSPAHGGSSFHGTHVAGTVAAETDNGTGVAGCSWGASIMPVRVLGVGGSGTLYDILQGVLYAAGLENDAGRVPATPADIINLSLGCSNCFNDTAQAVFAEVRAAGVIVVAAAGNEQSSEVSFPAGYGGVISVAALDRFKERAPYSNFGGSVDVAAPGGDSSRDADGDGYADGVLSTLGDDLSGSLRPSYGYYQGTSMAAPHVAGVLALMKSANPAFVTPDTVDALLASGALTEDLGPSGRDDVYGFGMIDAYRSVQAALSGSTPTTLSATPGTLYFDPSEVALSFALSVNGPGTLDIDAVTGGAAWVSVAEAGGPTQYDVGVDRTGLANGTYSTTITIDYSADGDPTRLILPVVVRVGSAVSANGDTGYTWVYLLDAVSRDPVYITSARNRDGAYSFAFQDVAPGSYVVKAGSDSDNDGYICDAGESCGGYPTLEQLQQVEVSEGASIQGIDFLSTFPAVPGTAAARESPVVPISEGIRPARAP